MNKQNKNMMKKTATDEKEREKTRQNDMKRKIKNQINEIRAMRRNETEQNHTEKRLKLKINLYKYRQNACLPMATKVIYVFTSSTYTIHVLYICGWVESDERGGHNKFVSVCLMMSFVLSFDW